MSPAHINLVRKRIAVVDVNQEATEHRTDDRYGHRLDRHNDMLAGHGKRELRNIVRIGLQASVMFSTRLSMTCLLITAKQNSEIKLPTNTFRAQPIDTIRIGLQASAMFSRRLFSRTDFRMQVVICFNTYKSFSGEKSRFRRASYAK